MYALKCAKIWSASCICAPLAPAAKLYPHQQMYKWLAYGNGEHCQFCTLKGSAASSNCFKLAYVRSAPGVHARLGVGAQQREFTARRGLC
eukprot:949359-Pelagomonas_calceolata.AAC.1